VVMNTFFKKRGARFSGIKNRPLPFGWGAGRPQAGGQWLLTHNVVMGKECPCAPAAARLDDNSTLC